MIQSIRQLLGLAEEAGVASVPSGQRVYAVGDIHGRLDLFDALVEAIEEDDACAVKARTTVVLLGDLVDRGPDSAGVVARAREWAGQRKLRALKGNHEEMFLESFRNTEVLRHFLRFGGKETLSSYGIDAKPSSAEELVGIQHQMRNLVPREHIEFLGSFEDLIVIGGYAFVHAGIVPDVDLEKQLPQDLRWIREPFLSHEAAHSHIIVHGHTIRDDVEIRPNRIGIDTGAFHSGCLTALVLEGTGRRFIETELVDGRVRTLARKAAA